LLLVNNPNHAAIKCASIAYRHVVAAMSKQRSRHFNAL